MQPPSAPMARKRRAALVEPLAHSKPTGLIMLAHSLTHIRERRFTMTSTNHTTWLWAVFHNKLPPSRITSIWITSIECLITTLITTQLQHYSAMTLTNFNDNILSLQLQHNLVEWQWQYFSITIITITSPITTLLQWHQISMTTSCHFNYNIIWLNDNGNILQLQYV